MSHQQQPGARASGGPGQGRRWPFLAGSGKVDITPPLEVGLLMSSVERRWAPFEGVRLPLHARALAVESAGRRVAVVSLELLGLTEEAVGGMEAFRARIIEAAGGWLQADSLVLASTHTHSSPETMALSDLCRTAAFRDWVGLLADRAGAAIRQAVERLRPCALRAQVTTAAHLAIHRRIKTTQGVLLSHPMPAEEIVLSREGAVDPSVWVAAFVDESARPAGVVVNAACHPVHEMCCPQVSPDYPGIMSAALERQFPGACCLFLNGADGNVNPPTVSGGPPAAEHHGLELAERVDRALGNADPIMGSDLSLLWQPLALHARLPDGRPDPAPLQTRIAALRIGDLACVFLPGEPFAETGLAIREQSPFPVTLICGYAEGSIGYVPTDEAFAEGGYETGPGAWSRVAPGSEGAVRSAAVSLLWRLRGSPTGSPEASGAAGRLMPRSPGSA